MNHHLTNGLRAASEVVREFRDPDTMTTAMMLVLGGASLYILVGLRAGMVS